MADKKILMINQKALLKALLLLCPGITLLPVKRDIFVTFDTRHLCYL